MLFGVQFDPLSYADERSNVKAFDILQNKLRGSSDYPSRREDQHHIHQTYFTFGGAFGSPEKGLTKVQLCAATQAVRISIASALHADSRLFDVHSLMSIWRNASSMGPPIANNKLTKTTRAFAAASLQPAESDAAPLVPALQEAVTTVLPAIQQMLARIATGNFYPDDAAKTARALETLTRTLRELSVLSSRQQRGR